MRGDLRVQLLVLVCVLVLIAALVILPHERRWPPRSWNARCASDQPDQMKRSSESS